jgi:hypothetical protein
VLPSLVGDGLGVNGDDLGDTLADPLHLSHLLSVKPSQKSRLTIVKASTSHMIALLIYVSAVNYDSTTADLIFLRVVIYPWPGESGLKLIS